MAIETPIFNETEPQNSTPRVLICDVLPDDALNPLRAKGYTVDVRTGLKPDELKEIIGGYDAAVVRSATKITPEVLGQAGNLELVVRAGVGIDNVDVAAATEKGITVANTPEANTRAAAEHAVALMFAVARDIPQAHGEVTERKWSRSSHTGTELQGKTLALLGFGNVGSEVASMAKGIGMDVVAYDPFPNKDRAERLGVSIVSLEEALQQGDFVSVHVPLIPQTKHLINEARLRQMKKNAVVINTSRGGIVDEEALVEAIDAGVISGGALDVFEGEPEVKEAVRNHPKIVKTPHLGASTTEAQERVTEAAVQSIINHFEGRPLHGGINIPRISPEELRALAPYSEVASRITSLAVAIAAQPVESVAIRYAGENLAGRDTRTIKAAVVKGLLASATDAVVNLVNYEDVVKKRGLVIAESTEPDGEYSNLIQVRLVHPTGGATEISGVHGHDGPRVVSINGLRVDLSLANKEHLLLVENRDTKGMIAQVTQVVGESSINIADMCVARNEAGGNALMILSLDSPMDEEQAKRIEKISNVASVRYLKLT